MAEMWSRTCRPFAPRSPRSIELAEGAPCGGRRVVCGCSGRDPRSARGRRRRRGRPPVRRAASSPADRNLWRRPRGLDDARPLHATHAPWIGRPRGRRYDDTSPWRCGSVRRERRSGYLLHRQRTVRRGARRRCAHCRGHGPARRSRASLRRHGDPPARPNDGRRPRRRQRAADGQPLRGGPARLLRHCFHPAARAHGPDHGRYARPAHQPRVRTERAVAGARRAAAGPSADLLVDLATRFYVAGQSQIEIARALGLDASTVSRYLKRARDEGIVHVEIKRPRSLQGDLALELASTFHLKKAVVVAGPPGPGSGDAVAKAAADYVNSRLLNGMRLGLSWGRMLSAAIHKLDDSAPLIRDHHISPRDRQRLLAQGAVGDMSTRFFNSEGEPVHVLDDRLIAVEWEQLKGVPLVIAMASGLEKRAAILGALRAACMDVLITDELTARSVLKAGRTG